MVNIEWIAKIRNEEAEKALANCSELLSLGFNADSGLRDVAQKYSVSSDLQAKIDHYRYNTTAGPNFVTREIANEVTSEYIKGANLSPHNKHSLSHLVYGLLHSGLIDPTLKYLSIQIMRKDETNGAYVVNGDIEDVLGRIARAVEKYDIWKRFDSGPHSPTNPFPLVMPQLDETMSTFKIEEVTHTNFPIFLELNHHNAENKNIEETNPRKCKWSGTPGEFGAIFKELITQGFITNIDGNLKRTVRLLFDCFEIKNQSGNIVDFEYLYKCFEEKKKNYHPKDFKIPRSANY